MTNVAAELVKFALSDLRSARKNGEMTVAQTTVGNVNISYVAGGAGLVRKNQGLYRIVVQKGLSVTVIAERLTSAEAVEYLVSVYDVVAA